MNIEKQRDELLEAAIETSVNHHESGLIGNETITFTFTRHGLEQFKRLIIESAKAEEVRQEPVGELIEFLGDNKFYFRSFVHLNEFTQLYTRPQPVRELSDADINLMAHNDCPDDWNDLRYKECWLEGYEAGGKSVRAILKAASQPVRGLSDEAGTGWAGLDSVQMS